MDRFFAVPMIALISYLFLFISFMSAKKSKLINSFIHLLGCGILWTGGSLLMRMQMWPSVKVWFDVSIIGLIMFTYFLWLFAFHYTESKKTPLKYIWFILLAGATAINVFTGVFVRVPRLENSIDGGHIFVYDLTWTVSFLFVFCGAVVIHTIWMMVSYGRKDALKRRQLRPIIFGAIAIFAGQLMFLLPTFEGFPVDVASSFIMVMCLFYSLYKRRMFTLTMLGSKVGCYALAGVLSAFIFSVTIPAGERLLAKHAWFANETTLVIAVFFLAFTTILYSLLKKFIDVLFIKNEIAKTDMIKDFSAKVSQSLDIKEILELMSNVIYEAIDVDKVYVFIKSKEGSRYEMGYSRSILDNKNAYFTCDNPVIGYMSDNDGCVLMEEFKCVMAYKSMWETEKKQLSDFGIECFAPLKDEEGLVGFVAVSGKGKQKSFEYEAVSFLESVTSVASIAVKNSRLFEKVCNESRTDNLTGLYNRNYFFQLLDNEGAKGSDKPLALILLDIDDFKLYNQLYGIREGDIALRRIAETIKASVGDSGYVTRSNSKEFGIILPGYDMLKARDLAENIRKQIMNMNKSDSDYVMKILTVSGGVCAIPYAASNIKELVNNADMAVFQMKGKGKNGIMLSSGLMINSDGEGLQEQPEQRQEIYSEYASTIFALTATIDTKDHYTFNHSKNVTYYAAELGYACGMNDDSVEMLKEAGLLHDIGKIGIPENILNKPGKLTSEEYDIMKGHVENSVGIIRYLPSLDYVIPAVIGHHERYDGTGYPRQIAGKDIPLSARILCVADSFDAMISKRTYKKEAMSVEMALKEISNQAGYQFDPELAKLFISLVEDGKINIS